MLKLKLYALTQKRRQKHTHHNNILLKLRLSNISFYGVFPEMYTSSCSKQ